MALLATLESQKITPPVDALFTIKDRVTAHQAREGVTAGQLSPEDRIFWKNKPPEAIIIATSSVRKALMLTYLLHGTVFPGYELYQAGETTGFAEEVLGKSIKPPQLQEFFNQRVPNGDGKLKQKKQLGYFHGVPIFADPQNGEEEANEPKEQALLKVRDLKKKYHDQNVLILATDTVDKPNTSPLQLGKPMNMHGFSDDPEAFVEQFLATYYPAGTEIEHTNAIALLDTGSEADEGNVFEAQLFTKVSREARETIEVLVDCGGGGILQQLLDWEEQQLLEQLGDELTKQQLTGKDAEVIKWALYCQITGMPFWALTYAIEKHVAEQKIAPEDQAYLASEAVIARMLAGSS